MLLLLKFYIQKNDDHEIIHYFHMTKFVEWLFVYENRDDMIQYLTAFNFKLRCLTTMVHEICIVKKKIVVFIDWFINQWFVEMYFVNFEFNIIVLRATHNFVDRKKTIDVFNDSNHFVCVLIISLRFSVTVLQMSAFCAGHLVPFLSFFSSSFKLIWSSFPFLNYVVSSKEFYDHSGKIHPMKNFTKWTHWQVKKKPSEFITQELTKWRRSWPDFSTFFVFIFGVYPSFANHNTWFPTSKISTLLVFPILIVITRRLFAIYQTTSLNEENSRCSSHFWLI